jgi:hypothetical protein
MTTSQVSSAAPTITNGNEDDWHDFMLKLKSGTCTPFIGAGACSGVLPTGREIASQWAHPDYPFPDSNNLARVSQFVAIEKGADTPKLRLQELFHGKRPDFHNPDEPHMVLAGLRLPVYITTNYDDFMTQAIIECKDGRKPQRVCCQWHKARSRKRGEKPPPALSPSVDEPVIYHLHGVIDDINSMVLTEGDYLNFLIYISEEQELIPPCIEDAFTESSLLFMGYSLEDMNFKVLSRKLESYVRRNMGLRHSSVQLDPAKNATTDEQKTIATKQRDHLDKVFSYWQVKVYWVTCEEFAKRIRTSMEPP